MTRFDDRAARGAYYLDQRYREWDAGIDVDRLDMDNNEFDILGQMFGTFDDGLAHLALSDTDAAELGFVLPFGWERIFRQANYRKLTAAWRNQIQRRASRRAEKIAQEFTNRVLKKTRRDKPWLT